MAPMLSVMPKVRIVRIQLEQCLGAQVFVAQTSRLEAA